MWRYLWPWEIHTHSRPSSWTRFVPRASCRPERASLTLFLHPLVSAESAHAASHRSRALFWELFFRMAAPATKAGARRVCGGAG